MKLLALALTCTDRLHRAERIRLLCVAKRTRRVERYPDPTRPQQQGALEDRESGLFERSALEVAQATHTRGLSIRKTCRFPTDRSWVSLALDPPTPRASLRQPIVSELGPQILF